MIRRILVNDLVADCVSEGEDEWEDTSGGSTCTSQGKLSCTNEKQTCFNISQICTYRLNFYGYLVPCRTGQHIQNCQSFTCNMMFKCAKFYFISWSYVCDGKWDCPGGLDEHCQQKMINTLCVSMFKCHQTQVCAHLGDVCDGQKDCPFGDDEQFCSLQNQCPSYCECFLFSIRCKTNDSLSFQSTSPLPYQVVWIQRVCLKDTTEEASVLFRNAILFSACGTELYDVCRLTSEMNSLIKLDVSANNIKEIQSFCFNRPIRVKILDLSDNQISDIGQKAFFELSELSVLNLTKNLIFELKWRTFHGLSKISVLSLKFSNLSYFEQNLFENISVTLVETDNYRFCCVLPEEATCSASLPWYFSCSNLLPDLGVSVSFYCVSGLIISINIVYIVLQRVAFVKGLEQSGAL